MKQTRDNKRQRRRRRVKAKITRSGASKPRLSVFRSLRHISVQLIDEGKTIALARDTEIKGKKKPLEVSREVGKLIAQKALQKNITKVVFDRGGYKYHGLVQALAQGAREGGLQF